MRGDDPRHEAMFSYITARSRVPGDHPLRAIRRMDGCGPGAPVAPIRSAVHRRWGDRRFAGAVVARLLLQMRTAIRSERLLVENWDYSVSTAGLSG